MSRKTGKQVRFHPAENLWVSPTGAVPPLEHVRKAVGVLSSRLHRLVSVQPHHHRMMVFTYLYFIFYAGRTRQQASPIHRGIIHFQKHPNELYSFWRLWNSHVHWSISIIVRCLNCLWLHCDFLIWNLIWNLHRSFTMSRQENTAQFDVVPHDSRMKYDVCRRSCV